MRLPGVSPSVRWSLIGVALAVTAPRPLLGQETTPVGGRPTGLIYAGVDMHASAGDGERIQGLIVIDPETEAWLLVNHNPRRVRVAPDAKALVFSWQESLWTSDLMGMADPRKIAGAAGRDPIWSADGRRITFTKVVGGFRGDLETWQIGADGSRPTRLPIPRTFHVEDWSPDGSWLVATSVGRLHLIRPDGTGERQLAAGGSNGAARFSSDSRRVLFTHRVGSGGSLEIVEVDGTGRRTVYEDRTAISYPCWSPDGRRIAAAVFDSVPDENRVAHAIDERSNFRIEIMDSDGRNRRRLKLPSARYIGGPDWR